MAKQDNNKFIGMRDLYEQGMSLAQIGAVFGVTRQSVYGILKWRGMVLRSPQLLLCQYFNGMKFTLRNTGYYGRTDGDRGLMHRYIWEFHFGPIPEGYDVHHINRNKADNRVENLECLPKAEHASKYGTGCNHVRHRCGK